MDGDLARKLGNVPSLNKELMGTSFLAQNANKKSLTLNLKQQDARDVFKKLAKTADVIVENFRPGVMDRLGLSWKALAEVNPRLVYCAISGFGQTGPRGLRVFSDFEYEFRMALANHRLVPEIEVVSFATYEQHTFLSSSTVREIASLGGDVSSMVPPHVEVYLRRRFHELGDGQQLVPTSSLRD